MRLVCSKCGLAFESVLIDQGDAFKEILIKSQNHVKFRHQDIFGALALSVQMALAALATLIHFDECIVIPEDEKWVNQQMEKNQEIVMIALGYDPNEEEEEDDNDNQEEEGEEEISDLDKEVAAPEVPFFQENKDADN
jgi:hypothetical protein